MVAISQLGPFNGKAVYRVKADSQFWGIAIVENQDACAASAQLSWTMELNGSQISNGGWTIPAGGSALFTSISSSSVSAGTHTLRYAATSEGNPVLDETMSFIAG